MRTQLLIIDPQVDFCDPERGALYVPGAERDIARLASFVRRMGSRLDAIHVTLDTHHLVHIAHPIYWIDSVGRHPDPFTIIHREDVEAGLWKTTSSSHQDHAKDYLRALEDRGRYQLCIWPPHCLVGSLGHAVAPELFTALVEWESHLKIVDYVSKGANPHTEHYSALGAEVPDPEDPSTDVNQGLLDTLIRAETVLVAGEAASHCVANTARDLASLAGEDFAKRIVLLTDTTSPVPGFQPLYDEFLADMTARGMRLETTAG